MRYKIISYNVNGLRAAVNKGFSDWLKIENPDMICIQETKLQAGQVDLAIFESLGYKCYWHYAVKKGYSGVALFTKPIPIHVDYGIGIAQCDNEGRTIIADYGKFVLISAYFPSGTSGDERQDIKMKWLDDFYNFVYKLRESKPNVIVSGDYNICHKPIDINHPERHENYSGFLPEERAWMDKFTNSGFVDSFRVFNNKPNEYSWWSYRANSREKNLGWRIDYHMVTEPLKPALQSASILSNITHSDHCPVVVELDI
jgi:exodeoxyribonuclease-3